MKKLMKTESRLEISIFLSNKWILINRKLSNMYDKDENRKTGSGQFVELTEGKKILLDTGDGGRLIVVQLVSC